MDGCTDRWMLSPCYGLFFFVFSQLLKRREVCVPLKIEQLSVELDAWRACTQSNNSKCVTHTHTHAHTLHLPPALYCNPNHHI